jgi:single-strand DNA-binding protein
MLNKVMLIGNVGRPPETRTTDGGTTLTRFSLATNRRWTDDSGQRQEQTEWHQVVAFGRLGEIAGEIVAKGRLLYAEGRLHTSSWEDPESGQRHTRTEVIADTLLVLDRRPTGAEGAPPVPSEAEA